VVLVVDRYASLVSLSIIVLAITIPLARTAWRRLRRRSRPPAEDASDGRDASD
jgi:hypothetical protein